MKQDFVHLHVHTGHSRLDGLNKIQEIPTYVRDTLGQSALSISDHGSLGGTYSFFKECRAAGVKPIIGLEAYYMPEDRTVRERDQDGKAFYHMIILALNGQGLKNLFKLGSASYESGFYYKPRIDDQLLFEHQEGLAITTGCLASKTSRLINAGRASEAESWLLKHKEVFGDRLLAEFQLHDDPDQKTVNSQLLALTDKLGITQIVTNDSHYTALHDKPMQQLLLNMNTDGDADNFSFDKINVQLADYDWMLRQAQTQGLPQHVVSNTKYVADMVNDQEYFQDRQNRYPTFKEIDVPAHVALARLCQEGLTKRFGTIPPQYQDRLQYELLAIKNLGFSDYMLILWRLLVAAREMDCLPGPGRGSAAGSLVAYALGITGVDPIKYRLLFERFCNPGRGATPMHFTPAMRAHAHGDHCGHNH